MKLLSMRKIIVLATLLTACFTLNGCDQQAPAQGRGLSAPAEVRVTVIQAEPIVLTTELPGRVSAFRFAEIRPQVSGLIQKRLFTEGADVEAGQVLYQIDAAPFQAALDNAEANLAVVRKTTERAKASLEASLASIKQQQATLDFAKTNRKRFEELTANGAVSLTERDQAVTEDKVASAALKSAEAQVKRDREAVAEAEATIKQAEALVKAARINLEYTRLIAPITGRIGRSIVTEGAIATAYQAVPLATIQQMDPIYVDVPQATTELLRLRRQLENGNINQDKADQNHVKILLEDDSEHLQEGTLQFRDITVDPTTGSVILRIVVPNPNNVLLPGMYVRAVITEGVNEKALLIPQQAVIRDPKGNPYTLIVDSSDTVQQKTIAIDRGFGSRWLVTSGLAPGDRVIVEGMQKIRPGASVKVVSADASAKPKTAEPKSN